MFQREKERKYYYVASMCFVNVHNNTMNSTRYSVISQFDRRYSVCFLCGYACSNIALKSENVEYIACLIVIIDCGRETKKGKKRSICVENIKTTSSSSWYRRHRSYRPLPFSRSFYFENGPTVERLLGP